jgi:dynein heavy chain 2
MLLPVLASKTVSSQTKWQGPQSATRLAGSMVSVYEQLQAKFSRDARGHYIFSPVFLTQWCHSLLRYNLQECEVLEAWADAARRVFQDSLVGKHAADFEVILMAILRSDWSFNAHPDGMLFTSIVPVEKSPATDTHGQGRPLIRILENDYEALLQQGLKKYAREFRELPILLFTEVSHTSSTMQTLQPHLR